MILLTPTLLARRISPILGNDDDDDDEGLA